MQARDHPTCRRVGFRLAFAQVMHDCGVVRLDAVEMLFRHDANMIREIWRDPRGNVIEFPADPIAPEPVSALDHDSNPGAIDKIGAKVEEVGGWATISLPPAERNLVFDSNDLGARAQNHPDHQFRMAFDVEDALVARRAQYDMSGEMLFAPFRDLAL